MPHKEVAFPLNPLPSHYRVGSVYSQESLFKVKCNDEGCPLNLFVPQPSQLLLLLPFLGLHGSHTEY